MTTMEIPVEFLTPVEKAKKDAKAAARTLDRDQARYLVDTYYQMQEYRKASGNQERAMGESAEPRSCISWVSEQFETVEKSVKLMLGEYAKSQPIGAWAMSNYGIGPVISAGLLAHIDIEKAPGAGNIWRYAGLDPSVTWEKGQKRPWNAQLKVLCWKIGDSFVKFSNRDECFYGKCYRIRKAYEVKRNLGGELKANAAAKLERFNIKDKETRAKYESGMLPDGHVEMMARRWTVKLFLSHWHEMAWRFTHGGKMPRIYTFSIQGHRDYIPPPFIADHFPNYESDLPDGVQVVREYKV